MLRHFLGLDPTSYHEFLFSVAYIVIGIVVFVIAMNWKEIKAAVRAIADAYCEYEESIAKLTPEERAYLDSTNDYNLFI